MNARFTKQLARPGFVFVAVALFVSVLLVSRPTHAGSELVLVLNASNTANPSLDEVKRFYMGDAAYWPGNVPVRLTVRPNGNPASEEFFRALKVAPSRFRRVWQEKQLSGQGNAPEVLSTSADLRTRVAANAATMGFAMSDEIPANAPGIRVMHLR